MARMSASRGSGSRCFGGVKALEFTARGTRLGNKQAVKPAWTSIW
jgi:hypothetical protein